ncbi:CPBP family intramembrane metalloprotease [Salinirubellus salinus]|uniref:CPBP family intramembrane metalloprotease n=1 Tax=Salinirubellus salinus TaxID=1364945 RepID=A0A9E7U672_9EURY|nr:CPBP family intramembrane glutamic endopeptidase [Salinirubellus salinus]UWM56175.1 CPBP family intramembrane metalloprotease [Salinirubellus salinus]
MSETSREPSWLGGHHSPWPLVGALSLATLVVTAGNAITAPWGLGLTPGPVGYLAVGVTTYLLLALVVFVTLRARDVGRASLDARWPTRRDWGYIVGGFVGLFAVSIAAETAVRTLGLPVAQLQMTEYVVTGPLAGQAWVVLALIPVTLLLIGPVEELLFRNLLQKTLYEWLSPTGAIVLASVVFALWHLPALYGASATAVGVTLGLVTLNGLVLGWLYLRTRSVVVPAAVHGLSNAVGVAFLYLSLSAAV